ncbi:MAG: hypothetical protein NT080_00570, partial [Spirochaetes bacterium]|nr:hypothetical protein [Spirochaetota bacterium]
FPNGSLILGGPDLYYQYADQGGTSFQPGESRTYRLVKGNVQAGSFTWRVNADPNGRINELDETNNGKSLAVTVGN